MARRRAPRVQTGRGNDIVVVNTPAPVRRSSGGSRRRRSRGRSRRRSSNSVGGGPISQNKLIGQAIGGFAYGFLEKTFPQMPRLPGIGRSGTVALAVYFLKPRNQILRDIGAAAAVIAGYSFGATGTVSGYDDDEHGLAAET